MYLADLGKTEVINPHQVKFTFKSSHNPKMPLLWRATDLLKSRLDET